MRKLFLGCLLLIALPAMAAKKGVDIQPDNLFPKVKISTNHGDIVVELNRHKAALTVNNFLTYVANGSYNETIFHRIINGFVVQGGGYDADYQLMSTYPPIHNESGNGLKNDFGTISMARQLEPHSATRQFFFNMADNSSLDPGRNWGYTVFGTVEEGEDVLEKIQAVETHMEPKLLWPDVPKNPVVIQSITILQQN